MNRGAFLRTPIRNQEMELSAMSLHHLNATMQTLGPGPSESEPDFAQKGVANHPRKQHVIQQELMRTYVGLLGLFGDGEVKGCVRNEGLGLLREQVWGWANEQVLPPHFVTGRGLSNVLRTLHVAQLWKDGIH